MERYITYIIVGVVFGVASYGIAIGLRLNLTLVTIIASGIGAFLAGFANVRVKA